MLTAMPWPPPAPVIASSPAELRGSLGVHDRLVGYEAGDRPASSDLGGSLPRVREAQALRGPFAMGRTAHCRLTGESSVR